jgi:glutathione peroxidase
MKILQSFSCILLLVAAGWLTDIYSFSVPKIEGGNVTLSAYKGKKILVITLPIQQSSAVDSLLTSLDSLATVHAGALAIIAVPAIEDGYTSAKENTLKQWYRSKLGNKIVLTQGLYTRRTSGAQQHPLFAWLTQQTQNTHFDIDVTGPGAKYFAKSNGELYGVLIPQTRIGSTAVNILLQVP